MKEEAQTGIGVDEPIDFRAIYFALREKFWIIAAGVGLGCLLAVIYLLASPKVYAAETVVQVEQAPRKVVNIQAIDSEDLGSDEVLKTIEQNLSSPALLARVIQALKIEPSDLGLKQTPKQPYNQNELIRSLDASIKVRLIRGTRLISIVAESTKPKFAQRLSLAVVEEYIRMNAEQRVGSANEANGFLMTEAARLKSKLQTSEQALQDYKELTQAVSLQESQNITVEKLKELNAALTATKSDRLKLEADFAQAEKLSADELLRLPSVAESKAVLEQKRMVAEQEGVVANFGQRYGPLHPKLIQAKSQLDAQRQELARVIATTGAAIGSSYEAAKSTETKLEAALRDQEKKALELNKLAIPYNVLQREVEGDRALYDAVLNRMKEMDVVKSIQQDNILVKAPALVPDIPTKPRRLLVIAAALSLGFFFSVFVVLAMRFFDNSLKTVNEAEQFLGLNAVGVIQEAGNGAAPSEFLMLDDPSGPVAEGFRTLRTSLLLRNPGEDWKSLAITSALPHEGKTFCAVNYAIASAQQGLRTLLIDGDLRMRSLSKLFALEDAKGGMTDLMKGDTVLDSCVRESKLKGLFILPAGAPVSNPLEMLSSAGFSQIMDLATRRFDRIVLDTAPAGPVSDALLLLQSVDSICFVVAAGKTSRHVAARVLQKLDEVGSRPLGFIFNRVPSDTRLASYYGYVPGIYGKAGYERPKAFVRADSPEANNGCSEPSERTEQ